MVVNFLTGSLIFRKHKTGVHFVHENLVLRAVSEKNDRIYKISCYNTKKEVGQYAKNFEKRNCKIIYSHKIVRFLMYFLPCELFFGKADVYVCDGVIPHTMYRSKKIAIIHDLMVKIYPENYGFIKKTYLNFYFHSCKKADLIIAVSETTKKDINRFIGIPLDRIKVVPNGFSHSTPAIENHAILQNEKYVFYVGDLRKNKNILNEIKAVEKILPKYPKLKFYIAGKKTYEYENLYAYVEEHNLTKNIIFCGYISESKKAELYSKSIALLFASYYEGFGIPILEAASYGTAVITSNVSSMNEIAGNTSVLVNPNNVDEIASAIESLMNDKFRSSVVEKQKKLLSEYTWDNSYMKFKEILDKV